MRWGVHEEKAERSSGSDKKAAKQDNKLDKKIASSKYRADVHGKNVANYTAHIADIEKNGINSAQFRKNYGRLADKNDAVFYAVTGQTKAMALAKMHGQAVAQRNYHATNLNKETARIKELQSQKSTAKHADSVVDDILSHHGIKGMKWGQHKGSSSSSSSSKPEPSSDHETAEAHRARIKAGGVKALSNMDLEALNKRMQLEQTHRDLTGKRPSSFDKGHGHVKKVLAAGKTLADVYNTVNSPAGKALKTTIKKAAGV
jgi:hypothetical protein